MLDTLTRMFAFLLAKMLGLRYWTEWYVAHPLGDVKLHVYVVRRRPFGFAGVTLGRTLVTVVPQYVHEFAHHEATHAIQWRRHGVLFPLLYLFASVKGLFRTGNPYLGNSFEEEARMYENLALVDSLRASRVRY